VLSAIQKNGQAEIYCPFRRYSYCKLQNFNDN